MRGRTHTIHSFIHSFILIMKNSNDDDEDEEEEEGETKDKHISQDDLAPENATDEELDLYEGVSTAPPAVVNDSRHDDGDGGQQHQQRAIRKMREVQATVRVTGLRYVCVYNSDRMYVCVGDCCMRDSIRMMREN